MKVEISHLPNGVHDLDVVGEPADFELEDSGGFKNEIQVQLKLDKKSDSVYLQLSAKTKIRLDCDRCLDEFEENIAAQARIIFTRDASLGDNNDEVRDLELNQAELDITNDVHDLLLLAVPIKSLCKSDCKGLCPHCGENLNLGECGCQVTTVDPRWEALQALSKNRQN